MRIADPRQAGWGDLIQNVLNKDVQCFTTAEGAHVIRTFYLDVLEAEGWTVKEVSTLDQGDIAIYAEREQGLEQVGIGSIQEGSVISGYKRHVAIAVIPAPD